MDDIEVRALFRQAIAHDDEIAMREGIDLLLGLSDGGGLSVEQEYAVRHPDYVMEMPQSGERIRGRDKMREFQEAYPNPPSIIPRRVAGSGDVWVIEARSDYGDGQIYHVAMIVEFRDGKVWRDTRYYAEPFEPPAWRARWVESIEGPPVDTPGPPIPG